MDIKIWRELCIRETYTHLLGVVSYFGWPNYSALSPIDAPVQFRSTKKRSGCDPARIENFMAEEILLLWKHPHNTDLSIKWQIAHLIRINFNFARAFWTEFQNRLKCHIDDILIQWSSTPSLIKQLNSSGASICKSSQKSF